MRRGEQEDGRGFEAKGGDLLFSVNGMPTTGMLPRDIAHLLIGIDETHILLSHYESKPSFCRWACSKSKPFP
jgi:hypothetical protein